MKIETKFNIDDIVLYEGERQIIFGICYWVDRASEPWISYQLENDEDVFEEDIILYDEM